MGKCPSTWTPSCNGFARVEISGNRSTSDSSALLLGEDPHSDGAIYDADCSTEKVLGGLRGLIGGGKEHIDAAGTNEGTENTF